MREFMKKKKQKTTQNNSPTLEIEGPVCSICSSLPWPGGVYESSQGIISLLSNDSINGASNRV